KATFLEQGQPTEAAQLDSEINARKANLQAAVTQMISDAAQTSQAAQNGQAVNPTGTTTQPQTAEKRNLLATINEYMNTALTIIQKIQEMRATFRSARQDMPTGGVIAPGSNPQSGNPTTIPGDQTGQTPTGGQTTPTTETTEQVSGVVTQDGKPV